MRFLLAAFLLFSATPAQAATNTCARAYEDAAENYWYITGDMIRFKALFDNYNDLCRKYYPGDVAKLQPDADLLRDQVAQDMNDIAPAITKIFNTTLTENVPPNCTKDTKSRDKIRRAFLADIKKQSKTTDARMKKSGQTVRDPEGSLKLCRDLPGLAPMIRAKLGPDLSTPLLTMTELNRKYMVKDSGRLQKTFTVYRKTLQSLHEKKK